jgi:hypothetical protein
VDARRPRTLPDLGAVAAFESHSREPPLHVAGNGPEIAAAHARTSMRREPFPRDLGTDR